MSRDESRSEVEEEVQVRGLLKESTRGRACRITNGLGAKVVGRCSQDQGKRDGAAGQAR